MDYPSASSDKSQETPSNIKPSVEDALRSARLDSNNKDAIQTDNGFEDVPIVTGVPASSKDTVYVEGAITFNVDIALSQHHCGSIIYTLHPTTLLFPSHMIN